MHYLKRSLDQGLYSVLTSRLDLSFRQSMESLRIGSLEPLRRDVRRGVDSMGLIETYRIYDASYGSIDGCRSHSEMLPKIY
jgi:hypothetical protein